MKNKTWGIIILSLIAASALCIFSINIIYDP